MFIIANLLISSNTECLLEKTTRQQRVKNEIGAELNKIPFNGKLTTALNGKPKNGLKENDVN